MKIRVKLTGVLMLISVVLVHLYLFAGPNRDSRAAKSVVLRALEEELQRIYPNLADKGDPPPYFIGYQVMENHTVRISASLGGLQDSSNSRSRLLDVEVRVGDYRLDNTHQIRDLFGLPFGFSPSAQLPIEDDIDALKGVMWLETDRKYKAAVERLIRVKADLAVNVEEAEAPPDFSRETPQVAIRPLATLPGDLSDWENKIKRYSAIFKDYPEILESSAFMLAIAENKYLANTEGASLQHGRTHFRVSIQAKTKADDGMELTNFESFDAHSVEGLPDDATVERAIRKLAEDLKALRAALVEEAYSGPAILSGRSSAVFFHETFGHHVESHRQKYESYTQTFAKQLNSQVLPSFISVYDDPTLEDFRGIDLNGHYEYDDEGIRAQGVSIVENGILRNFLTSRSPLEGFNRSNGHGRKAPGYVAVGRQGNLIVEASKTVSEAELRKMLIEECKSRKKPYGLFFKKISGGFTLTARGIPQAFQVTPYMVYRVYVDGRPDELVRGVDLIGTPLTSLTKILAAGEKQEVFNGICGAESGWILVSAIAPSILTAEIETQKKPKSSSRPPILPPPTDEGHAKR